MSDTLFPLQVYLTTVECRATKIQAARTPDAAPNHRDAAAPLSGRDAVVHDGQRTIFPPSDTAQRRAATHPRMAGIASGDLLQERYSMVKCRVSFTRNVSDTLLDLVPL